MKDETFWDLDSAHSDYNQFLARFRNKILDAKRKSKERNFDLLKNTLELMIDELD